MFEKKPYLKVAEELKTDLKNGLSKQESQERLLKNGENKLAEKKQKTIVQMFVAQLNEPLIYILFAAAIISAFLKEISDAVIILIVILLNAVIGVIQEGKAQNALEALKKLSSPGAVVKRDGEVIEIPASELVVGDMVLLEAGRQVPADLRLTFSSNLKIEESALTGESVPCDKDAEFVAADELPLGDRINMAYMSTNVSYGRGEGVVVATGMDTQIGKIASMINESEEQLTPLQKRLAKLGKMLGIIAVVICAGLFLIAIAQKRELVPMLITSISLAVAAVPEGLPAVVTIVLALGVQRLVKVNTIVRRLPSVETLGSVSVVCSDKTGTLTQNKMTVIKCYCDENIFEAKDLDLNKHNMLINGFALCNDASVEGDNRLGDPTEIALLDMALTKGVTRAKAEELMPRIGELSFDSDRKMMTTLHGHNNKLSFTKGAPDVVLSRCNNILINGITRPITDKDKENILYAIKTMSLEALRVLSLAIKENAESISEENLTFVGLVGMIDPPRPEAKDSVMVFKGAGVKTVMITGDYKDTAFAIAKELYICDSIEQCMTGEELDKLSDSELTEKIDNLSVFARVSPEHKVKIVNSLKAKGYIVSMTGDGVNDAPSLKAADIGVAMGKTGTDVARSASDMVLADDNFATIKNAIKEGRGIYANIKKSVLFLLSSNFGEIITMFVAILSGLAAPLKAIHILWVNLITDTLPALGLGVDTNESEDIMKRAPRDPKENLFSEGGLFLTLLYGALIGAITLTAFLIIPFLLVSLSGKPVSMPNLIAVLKDTDTLARAQTYAFTVLGISQVFHAIGMRNTEKSVFKMNHKSNKAMIAAFFTGIFLQVIVTEVPILTSIFDTVRLSVTEWGILIALSTAPVWMHEILVPIRRAYMKRR